MDEKGITESSEKKGLTMRQATIMMVVGGIMFVLAIVIPTGVQSTAYHIKLIAGFLGLCIVFVGAYLRPKKASGDPQQ